MRALRPEPRRARAVAGQRFGFPEVVSKFFVSPVDARLAESQRGWQRMHSCGHGCAPVCLWIAGLRLYLRNNSEIQLASNCICGHRHVVVDPIIQSKECGLRLLPSRSRARFIGYTSEVGGAEVVLVVGADLTAGRLVRKK